MVEAELEHLLAASAGDPARSDQMRPTTSNSASGPPSASLLALKLATCYSWKRGQNTKGDFMFYS